MRGFLGASAWWDADRGPPRALLLPRGVRAATSLHTRVLADVFHELEPRVTAGLGAIPWVLGMHLEQPDEAVDPLREVLQPAHGVTRIYAGTATVAMTLVEALSRLVAHHAVLVAFMQAAAPPHHEALAAALYLGRDPDRDDTLVLQSPTLRRSHAAQGRRLSARSPLDAALRLAQAADVGEPTVQTVPSPSDGHQASWRIELCRTP